MTDSRYNLIIIGGGVVRFGVALETKRRFPHSRLLLLEIEDRVARHQSGAEYFRRISAFALEADLRSALQRLLPEVQEMDLVPVGSEICEQALKPDGTLVDDFHFVPSANCCTC